MPRLPSRAFAALPLLASLAVAQTSTIIDRADQPAPVVPPAPSDLPSRSDTPGAGSDEGVQRVAEPRRLPFKFSANLDQLLYATDNVFLENDGSAQSSEEALVSVSTIALRAETLPAVVGRGRLVASAGFVYQRYTHGVGQNDADIEELDFESYTLPLGVAYRWGQGWEANADLSLGQLYSVRGAPSHEKLYASATAATGLRKLTELRRDVILSTGVGLSHAETWTSLNDVPALIAYRDDRNDKLNASADASLFILRGDWVAIPYVRLARAHYYHYEEAAFTPVDRDDTTLSAGFTLAWNFTDWGSVRANVGYDERFSNQDGPGDDYTYSAGSVGVALGLNLRY